MAPPPGSEKRHRRRHLHLLSSRSGSGRICWCQEFSRLIGAIEQQVQDRPPGWLELAGAVLPANDLGCALAAHISSQGVVYTSDESSTASSGDEQIDD
jgi:hypothetical protein